MLQVSSVVAAVNRESNCTIVHDIVFCFNHECRQLMQTHPMTSCMCNAITFNLG